MDNVALDGKLYIAVSAEHKRPATGREVDPGLIDGWTGNAPGEVNIMNSRFCVVVEGPYLDERPTRILYVLFMPWQQLSQD